jgi:hypothetical protein
MCFENKVLIKLLANRLVQMYKHESKPGWHWFESYDVWKQHSTRSHTLCLSGYRRVIQRNSKNVFRFYYQNNYRKQY